MENFLVEIRRKESMKNKTNEIELLFVCEENKQGAKREKTGMKQYRTKPENNLFNLPGKVLLCFSLLYVSYIVHLERIIQFCSLLSTQREEKTKRN